MRVVPRLDTDSRSDEEKFDQHHEDTMAYPYPKYNHEADAEAHVRAFLTTWQANHVSQRLLEMDVDKSKIVEFELSLEGQ